MSIFYLKDGQNTVGQSYSENKYIAVLEDELMGALVGIARAVNGNEHLLKSEITALVLEGLAAPLTKCNYSEEYLKNLLVQAEEAKRKLVPDCFVCVNSCGRTANYNMSNFWQAENDVRRAKALIIYAMRTIAVFAGRARKLNCPNSELENLLYKGLFIIGEDLAVEDLMSVALELGDASLVSRNKQKV